LLKFAEIEGREESRVIHRALQYTSTISDKKHRALTEHGLFCDDIDGMTKFILRCGGMYLELAIMQF
jgi:hypothetical protein